jgi:predicted DNA-binding protein (UPF0251 family)
LGNSAKAHGYKKCLFDRIYLLYYWAATELGISQSVLSNRLELAPSAVSLAVVRGRELDKKHHYKIEN